MPLYWNNNTNDGPVFKEINHAPARIESSLQLSMKNWPVCSARMAVETGAVVVDVVRFLVVPPLDAPRYVQRGQALPEIQVLSDPVQTQVIVPAARGPSGTPWPTPELGWPSRRSTSTNSRFRM